MSVVHVQCVEQAGCTAILYGLWKVKPLLNTHTPRHTEARTQSLRRCPGSTWLRMTGTRSSHAHEMSETRSSALAGDGRETLQLPPPSHHPSLKAATSMGPLVPVKSTFLPVFFIRRHAPTATD